MTGLRKRPKRPDWLIALAMLAGAAVPVALIALFVGPAPWWSGLAAGLLAVPGAFFGGCVALIGEDKRDW